MSNRTYLGRRMQRFTSAPQFDGFSKVTIVVNDEIEYSAGTDTGRTLRITNPWGTPQMAQDILNDIRGFQYQPYTAENALIDPAAELGDGVMANNVYSGLYTQKIRFGPLLTATVSAPEDEELNHEYPYKSKPNKEITREAKMLRASLAIEAARITAEIAERKSAVETLNAMLEIQATKIEAKVSKTGSNEDSTFGWTLTDSAWTIKANKLDVLKATKDGLAVYGKVTATSGAIGGFDIQTNYLSYNNHEWGGTNAKGIYIGVSGIQLGTSFKVDDSGNLTASSGKFEGTVYAGSIKYGKDEAGNDAGYFSGSGISSGSIIGNRLAANTVSTSYTSVGINSSLARADAAYNWFTGVETAESFIAKNITGTKKGSFKTLYIDGVSVTKKSTSFKDGDGKSVTIAFWG